MLARLFSVGDEVIVAYEGGDFISLSESEVKNFFLHADELTKKFAKPHLNLKVIDMSLSTGSTLAYVNSDYQLVITDFDYYRSVMKKPPVYVGIKEFGEIHGRKRGAVLKQIAANRIEGATTVGNMWIIPSDAEYPDDARFGSRKDLIEKTKEDI